MSRDDIQRDAGVGLLPSWLVAEGLRTGELAELLPGLSSRPQPVHALWPAAPYLPSKVRAVIDALVEQVPPRLGAVAPAG